MLCKAQFINEIFYNVCVWHTDILPLRSVYMRYDSVCWNCLLKSLSFLFVADDLPAEYTDNNNDNIYTL